MIDSEIETLLNANWNTSIIAKPTFKQGQFDPRKGIPREVRIQDLRMELQAASADLTLDYTSEGFQISMCESHDQITLTASEVKRILHQATLATGWYRVVSSDPEKLRDHTILTFQCVKEIFKEVTTW